MDVLFYGLKYSPWKLAKDLGVSEDLVLAAHVARKGIPTEAAPTKNDLKVTGKRYGFWVVDTC